MHLTKALAAAPSALRCPQPSCSFFNSDDRVDKLVLYSDAGVLLGYGSIQGIVDSLAAPFADGTFEPVAGASLQGCALAALWVGITLALRGYRPAATRSLPSSEWLAPLVAAWVGSSVVLLAACAAAGLPLGSEAEFVVGGGVVIGGWRWLYSQGLPLP